MIKRLLRLVGRWARKPVNHTSWVALVTPTDRPKSVRNRCLIELFCGVVCVVTLPCWCRGFCHRTESDLFLFLSVKHHLTRDNTFAFMRSCGKDVYKVEKMLTKFCTCFSVSFKSTTYFPYANNWYHSHLIRPLHGLYVITKLSINFNRQKDNMLN